MANHLNLRHTLLEFDLQGNLSVFSHGRSARLLAPEVQQLLDWLAMNKDEQLAQLRTEGNAFRLANGILTINGTIRIVPVEVRQMCNWIRPR